MIDATKITNYSSSDFELSTKDLASKVLHSKRHGFYEALGELQGKTVKGNFKLICEESDIVSCFINLKTPNYEIHINELG